MTKHDEEKFMSMFGKAFNDVVLPALEGLHERIENIENTMATN